MEPLFEHRYSERTRKLIVSAFADVSSGFMTCCEVRFPEIAHALALGGAQIIFLPAAWPKDEQDIGTRSSQLGRDLYESILDSIQ